MDKGFRDKGHGPVKSRGRNLAFLSALLSLLNGRPELRADPERGGVDALAQRLRMQPALLRECLELFYNGRREGNVEVYERPGQRKELLIAYVLVLAQLLEGGGLAAPQFEALRLELKMKPSDLVQRFREVGSTCQPTLYKGDDGEGGAADGPSTRAYNVILLKGGKTLGECFPGIKVGPKRK
ncbi:hypothetical protein FOA52_013441 [Chlamydomonas sp. UWO 241]|nr:hypothetical protein FOA52_013441 [Chlamydomonas sp. UWO 241]